MDDFDLRASEHIRALVARFHMLCDRGRFAETAACFTHDGEVRWPNGGGRGRDGIAASLTSATPNPAISFVRHHLTTVDIQIDPDRENAGGRLYYLVVCDIGLDHSGVFVDRYRQEQGEWLIASREVRIDWQSPDSPYRRTVSR